MECEVIGVVASTREPKSELASPPGATIEPLRMLDPRTVQRRLAVLVDIGIGALVHGGGCVPADPRVMVHVVVIGEECVAERLRLGKGIEVVWEVGHVLQCLELGFGERVVVGLAG